MIVPDWAGYLRFRPAFAEVMDERYYTPEWLDMQLLSGAAKFWRTDAAGLVTEIKCYPTGAADIHVMVAAGDMDDIVNVLRPQAEAYGRTQNCIASTVESRPGWAKVLKQHGYEPHQLTVRKELTWA